VGFVIKKGDGGCFYKSNKRIFLQKVLGVPYNIL